MSVEKLGILVGPKGRGSNMRALVEASPRCDTGASVEVVISGVSGTLACEFAESQGVRLEIVPPGERYGERLLAALGPTTIVCLAGFTRLLPDEVLDQYPGAVLNIHPALLPKYGGKGMYGMHVHEAIIAAGETESGCTVHLVTSVYDEGEIVLQKKCAVELGDTPETLAAKILMLEHVAYPEAVKKIVDARAS